MKKELKLILLLVVMVFSACTGKIDRFMVVGKYTANQDRADGIDYLILNSDGTYTHYFETGHGAQEKNSGTWRLDNKVNPARIKFDNFKSRLPFKCFSYNEERTGYWSTAIETSIGGKIRLVVDDDVGCYYEKEG